MHEARPATAIAHNSSSLTSTSQSQPSQRTISKRESVNTIEELVNGQNKIKPLTIDIFANVGTESKSNITAQRSPDNNSSNKNVSQHPYSYKLSLDNSRQRQFEIPSDESKEQIEPEQDDQFYGLGHTGGVKQENTIFSGRLPALNNEDDQDDDGVDDPLQNFLKNHQTLFPKTTKVKDLSKKSRLQLARPKSVGVSRNKRGT